MPNHFTTVGLCSRDYYRLEALGKEDFSEIDFAELKNKNLCEIVTSKPIDCNNWYSGPSTTGEPSGEPTRREFTNSEAMDRRS